MYNKVIIIMFYWMIIKRLFVFLIRILRVYLLAYEPSMYFQSKLGQYIRQGCLNVQMAVFYALGVRPGHTDCCGSIETFFC